MSNTPKDYSWNNTWSTDTVSIDLTDMISTSTMNDSYVLTSGSNGIDWGAYSIGTSPDMTVKGNVVVDGELSVQGVKLSERLDKIEEKLAILHPNEELEEKWENLRGLRKAYMELEAEIIEKEKMWAILKK